MSTNRRTFIEDLAARFREQKQYVEAAAAQLTDAEIYFRINPLQNSIAVIMRHIAGNMKSRWTDFPTSDGEKPWRNRESEFHEEAISRAAVIAQWEDGWNQVFSALNRLSESDLGQTTTIRSESMSVFSACLRSLAHTAWHTGQIVLIGKQIKGASWRYLTIPPGGSAACNEALAYHSGNQGRRGEFR